MFINRPIFYRDEGEPTGGFTPPSDSAPATLTAPDAATQPAPAQPAPEPVAVAPRAWAEPDFAAAIAANRIPVGDIEPPVAVVPAVAQPSDVAPGIAPTADVVPAETAAAATTEPVAADAPVVPTADELLMQAAELLGIKETEPAKIKEMIEAKRQEQATTAQAQQEEADRAYEAAQMQRIETESLNTVMEMASPVIAESVRSQMRAEGLQVDVPNWWLPETWDEDSPDYGPQMLARFNELKEIQQGRLQQSDDWKRTIENERNTRIAAFNNEKATLSSLGEKYTYHDKFMIAQFRRSGADVNAIEALAQMSHANAERIHSTINSELATTRQKLSVAEAQIASHAKAIDDAYQRGRNETVQELGQPNPATLGINSSADQGTGTVWRDGRRYVA